MIVHVEHITEIIKSINWIKYQSKVSTQGQKQYLDYLIDPDSKGTKGPFFLSFKIMRLEQDTQDTFLQK